MTRPIREPKADRPEPAVEPTPNELRRQDAERGDVDYFLDIIRTKLWSMFSLGDMLRHLMLAAEVAARDDPEEFARHVFARMVGFNSSRTMRTQLLVAERAVGGGPRSTTPALAGRLPPRSAVMLRVPPGPKRGGPVGDPIRRAAAPPAMTRLDGCLAPAILTRRRRRGGSRPAARAAQTPARWWPALAADPDLAVPGAITPASIGP